MKDILGDGLAALFTLATVFVLVRPGSQGPGLVTAATSGTQGLVTAATGGGTWSGK